MDGKKVKIKIDCEKKDLDLDALNPLTHYRISRNSIYYNMSELMFGSLLVSFLLGFLTVSFGEMEASVSLSDFFVHAFRFLPISVSCAFITGVVYVLYHSNILTIPGFKLTMLIMDFMIALLIGILYGSSMINIKLFPGSIGILFNIALLRQFFSFKQIKNLLFQELEIKAVEKKKKKTSWAGRNERDCNPKREFKKLLLKILDEDKRKGYEIDTLANCWREPRGWMWLVCILFSISVGAYYWFLLSREPSPSNMTLNIINLCLALAVIIYGLIMIYSKSKHIPDRPDRLDIPDKDSKEDKDREEKRDKGKFSDQFKKFIDLIYEKLKPSSAEGEQAK